MRIDRYQPTPRVEVPLPRRVQSALSADVSTIYYDKSADRRAVQAYYRGIDSSAGDLFDQLCDLTQSTHHTHLDYSPRDYNWVHMSPNLRLQPLYGDEKADSADPIRAGLPPVSNKRLRKSKNAAQEALDKLKAEAEELGQTLAQSPLDAVQTSLNLAAFEAKRFFNMEHVVARIWHDRNPVMEGDLHILFPELKDRNSFRGNLPLRDLPGPGDSRTEESFEPLQGKGAAARATLYFLVRYPMAVGGPGQISREDLKTLIRWSQEDPPGLYERHRNAEIEKIQGNRNPFIDHPEWVGRVNFSKGVLA